MAKLPLGVYRDPTSGNFRINFSFGGQRFHRTLDTSDETKMRSMVASIREAKHDLKRGKLELPAGADLWEFLVSGGKRQQKLVAPERETLSDLFEWYFRNMPEGSKEPKTLKTEKVHRDHFLHTLGKTRSLAAIAAGDLQSYINARAKQKWHGRTIRSDTIQKEMDTLLYVWRFAFKQGGVHVPAPDPESLRYAKGREKPPFQTWDQIERAISRGGLTEDDIRERWDCLYLDLTQINEILEYTRTRQTRSKYFYPLIVFVAHTGARLAEAMRSLVEDLDFESGTVLIREKKRSKEKQVTFRSVPMSQTLAEAMTAYFKSGHPGGIYTFSREAGRPMLESTLHEAFEWSYRDSKWNVLKGYHVFRHSFASNLARKNVPDRVIDKLMGHQTEAMRKRYRHLFPGETENAITTLFS